MAQTRQVGRVSLRVTPDTKRFRSDLESDLERLERALEINVPAALDTSALSRQARAAGTELERLGRKIGDDLADGIDRGLGDPVTEALEESTRKSRRKLPAEGQKSGGAFADAFRRRVSAALSSLPEVDITADTRDVDIALQVVRKNLAELGNKRIGVDIDADIARAELGVLRSELEGLAETASIDVKANVAAATAQLAAFERTLEKLDGDKVEVEVEADTDPARRSLASLSRDAARIGANIAKVLGGPLAKLTGGGLVFSLLAGSAAAAVPSVLQLVAALAPAAGILAALPAYVVLTRAALGVLKVALVGVGDAFKAALEGDAAKFQEALQKLAPEAQKVAKELQALKPQLDELRKSVQGALFAPMVGQLKAVAAVLLGPLKQGMTEVSGEFGRLAAAALRFGQSNSAVELVTGTFRTLKTELAGVKSTTVEILLGAIARFTAATLPAFSGLGASVNDLADRFANFLSRAAESGQALKWVQDALAVFKQLGALLADVFGIIRSVFTALQTAGGGALGVIGQLADRLNAFFKSAQGQQALVSIFTALGQIGQALFPVFQALAGAIAAIAPQIAKIAVALGPALASAIKALGPALAALGPGLTAVAQGLAAAFANPAVGAALLQLGRAISAVLVALAPLIPVIVQVAAVLVSQLARAVLAIAPYLQPLVKAFGELLIALVPLIPPVIDLVVALAPLIPIVTDVIKIITTLAKIIVSVLVTGLQGLAMHVRDVATRCRDGWNQIKDAFSTAVEAIKRVFAWFGTLPGLIGGWLNSAKSRVTSALSSIRSTWSAAWTAARTLVTTAWQKIVSTVSSKVSSLLSTVRGIPGRIKSALGSLGSLLYNAGRNVIQGLINGIRSMIGAVGSAISNIAATIRSRLPFSPAKEGPLRTHPPDKAGRTIAQMIADGMASGENLVARAASAVAAAALPDVTPHLQAASTGGARAAGGITVNNYYPQAEPTSTTVNRALQYASALGTI